MDLIEQLRRTVPRDSGYAEQANAAANEIERLRSENNKFRCALFGANGTLPRDDLSASQGPKQSRPE